MGWPSIKWGFYCTNTLRGRRAALWAKFGARGAANETGRSLGMERPGSPFVSDTFIVPAAEAFAPLAGVINFPVND